MHSKILFVEGGPRPVLYVREARGTKRSRTPVLDTVYNRVALNKRSFNVDNFLNTTKL